MQQHASDYANLPARGKPARTPTWAISSARTRFWQNRCARLTSGRRHRRQTIPIQLASADWRYVFKRRRKALPRALGIDVLTNHSRTQSQYGCNFGDAHLAHRFISSKQPMIFKIDVFIVFLVLPQEFFDLWLEKMRGKCLAIRDGIGCRRDNRGSFGQRVLVDLVERIAGLVVDLEILIRVVPQQQIRNSFDQKFRMIRFENGCIVVGPAVSTKSS